MVVRRSIYKQISPNKSDVELKKDEDVAMEWQAVLVGFGINASIVIVGFSVLELMGWHVEAYSLIMFSCGFLAFLSNILMLGLLVRRLKARRGAREEDSVKD